MARRKEGVVTFERARDDSFPIAKIIRDTLAEFLSPHIDKKAALRMPIIAH